MDADLRRPLVILDLDETLIFGSESQLHREADFRVGPYHIYKRPALDAFLRSISQKFDVAIWSSASEDYVDGISGILSVSVGRWKFVWARKRCVQRLNPETFESDYIKDLRKVERLGFDLDQTLIVDDTPRKVSRNYGNAIYVSPFFGSDDDVELPLLQLYIDSLHREYNYRRLEKRGWRTRVPSPPTDNS
jgi:TFIIF-interacting CTD phosphatase-like protein